MNWFWLSPQAPEAERASTPAPVLPTGQGVLETRSSTWAFVLNYAQTELAKQRERNDSIKWDAIQTAEIRGRIKALKEMIALGSPKADKRQFSVEED